MASERLVNGFWCAVAPAADWSNFPSSEQLPAAELQLVSQTRIASAGTHFSFFSFRAFFYSYPAHSCLLPGYYCHAQLSGIGKGTVHQRLLMTFRCALRVSFGLFETFMISENCSSFRLLKNRPKLCRVMVPTYCLFSVFCLLLLSGAFSITTGAVCDISFAHPNRTNFSERWKLYNCRNNYGCRQTKKKEKSANGDYTRNSVATVNRSHYQILFTTCSRSTTFPPLSTRPVRLVWFLRYLSPHIEIRTMMTEWVSATNTKQDSRLCWVCVLAPSRVISWRWSGRQ